MDNQTKTKATYEDANVVKGYIEHHAKNPKLHGILVDFAKKVSGKKIIDVGCGPGHDSYKFAELGFEVVGIDYSKTMIESAKTFRESDNKPTFQVMDMYDLAKNFPEDNFDAAWVSASLLHIPKQDAGKILEHIHKVVKTGGKVFIGLKGGTHGEVLVEEERYDSNMAREFIFWDRVEFEELLAAKNFKIIDFKEMQSGITLGEPTSWLNFQVEVI